MHSESSIEVGGSFLRMFVKKLQHKG